MFRYHDVGKCKILGFDYRSRVDLSMAKVYVLDSFGNSVLGAQILAQTKPPPKKNKNRTCSDLELYTCGEMCPGTISDCG